MNRRHVVVTGASAGIGLALARAFAAGGARLTLVARRQDRLDALAASLPVPCHVVVADLSRSSDDLWLAEAEAVHGPVDVLVNNAGHQVVGRTHQVDLAAAERSIGTNLLTPLRLTHRVLPGMLARATGTIVNVASLAALAPTPGMTWYNASKAGIAAASEALRGELRGSGVNVVTVYPGIIPETDMATRAMDHYGSSKLVLRLQPTGTAERLAALVVAAVDRGQGRVIYPKVNHVVRHFPATVRWAMDRFTPPVPVA